MSDNATLVEQMIFHRTKTLEARISELEAEITRLTAALEEERSLATSYMDSISEAAYLNESRARSTP